MNTEEEYLKIKEVLLSEKMNAFMLGLERIQKCLDLLGNPQDELKIVHVVGTNGKGSSSKMLSGILKEDGYRVGLFTSPYITELTEYIYINDKEISGGDFVKWAKYLLDFCALNDLTLSHFEFITILSVLYFKDSGCDYCVYEAGLGGESDATNIFSKSLLTVLTSVGLDHTEFLGDSIEKVVRAKLGICSSGETVVSTDCILGDLGEKAHGLDHSDEAVEIINKVCTEKNLKLYQNNEALDFSYEARYHKIFFDYKGYKNLMINSPAAYQAKNAVCAVSAYLSLCEISGFVPNEQSIRKALSDFTLKARFEKLPLENDFYIDGGHNSACISELCHSLDLNGIKNVILLTGVMADKDYVSMYEMLDSYVSRYVCIDENIKRALKTDELAGHLVKFGKPVTKAYSAGIAAAYISCIAEKNSVILYAGTLYMSDAVRKAAISFFDDKNTEKDYTMAVERLSGKAFFSKNYSLPDMSTLLKEFGDPQDRLNIVHVAGTNGKGSVCSMLASIFEEAGLKTGLFTSPYLREFGERIRLDGKKIEKKLLSAITDEIDKRQKEHGFDLNQFALVTMLAFIYYSVTAAEILVLETGLGGTYDPTNIVKKPLCTVIMNIGMDHMAVLGNTIEEIAKAKAGIIKPSVPLVIYPSCKEAVKVITDTAEKCGAPYVLVDKNNIKTSTEIGILEHRNAFNYKEKPYCLFLEGDFQRYNAAVAIECAGKVLEENADKDVVIRKGLENCRWAGRLEKLSETPLVYADGGHNPQCIEAVVSYLDSKYPDRRKIYIVAFLKDKAYREMYELISASADSIYAFPLKNPRTLSKMELTNLQKNYIIKGRVSSDAKEAYELALSESDDNSLIVFTGSLYMLDEVYKLFGK